MDHAGAPVLPRELDPEAHGELIQLLEETARCVGGGAMAMAMAFHRQLLHRTEIHFQQEEQWMRESHFAPDAASEHSAQHRAALKLLGEVRRELQRCYEEDAGAVERLVGVLPEVAGWFHDHAAMMDAVLARHVGHEV